MRVIDKEERSRRALASLHWIEEHADMLLYLHTGQHVVVLDGELMGNFPTFEAASEWCGKKLPLEPCVIHSCVNRSIVPTDDGIKA